MSTFGKRGGQGPTAGMQAAVYEVVFPDGTSVQKRKFIANPPDTAPASIYKHDGKWHATVWLHSQPHEGDCQLTARRIK